MKKNFTAIVSGLLVGLSLRALLNTLRQRLPGSEKAWLIALLIAVVAIAAGCLLWAAGLV